MSILKLFFVFCGIALLSGCVASGQNMPLIFAQSQTVGLSMGGSAADQGAKLTLGYEDYNVAIIPVSIKQSDGNSTLIRSVSPESANKTSCYIQDPSDTDYGCKDAMSVFGQFSLGADAKETSLGLNKFFATGTAATALAEGFRVKLGGKSDQKNADDSASPAGATQD